MSDEHRDILMSQRSTLVSHMTLSDDLINQLISKRVIKIDDSQAIRRNDANENEKVFLIFYSISLRSYFV